MDPSGKSTNGSNPGCTPKSLPPRQPHDRAATAADRSVRQLHPLRVVLCACPSRNPTIASRSGGPRQALPLSGRLAESRDGTTLEQEDSQAGMWVCHTIMKCGRCAQRKSARPTGSAACGGSSSHTSSNRFCGGAPVKLEQSHLERRRFLCNMLGGGALALGPAWRCLWSSTRATSAGCHARFSRNRQGRLRNAAGKSRMLMYGPIPVLLLRTPQPESELRIFVATCTHLNCTVGYREEQNASSAPVTKILRHRRQGRFRSAAASLRSFFSKQRER